MPRKRRPAELEASSPAERIVELEAELRQRDEEIKELRTDLAKAEELVAEEREHVEDTGRVLDQWIEVFDVQPDDNGGLQFNYTFVPDDLRKPHAELLERHRKLVRAWNEFVPQYNARVPPREIGRPIAVSEAQQADVRKRRKAGASLRRIASATGLGLSTIRTILGGWARQADQRTARHGVRPVAGRRLPGQSYRSRSLRQKRTARR